jgi:hypothetical protein
MRKWNLDRIERLAAEKGGRCLDSEYRGFGMKYALECADGHSWEITPNNLNKGRWCPRCYNRDRKSGGKFDHLRLSIENAREAAVAKGGLCLSPEYVSARTQMLWQCAERHEWTTTYNKISSAGTWCPQCATNTPGSLEEALRLAADAGGQCLSTQYTNAHAEMRWRCAKGHEWNSPMKHVKNSGIWCPDCKWKTEQKVRDIVEATLGAPTPKARPAFMRNPDTGRILELDGYNADLGIAWEYNGEQHYRRVFGTEDIAYRKALDALKIQLCEENWVTLIVVPCDEVRREDLRQFIEREFACLGA